LPNTSEKILSFHQTDSSPSWTHKSDSLPNFGVNTLHLGFHSTPERKCTIIHR
jgi:hypothetical protein